MNVEAIVKACKITGAQAVHLGYGFLSEKFRFVDALNKNGIVFIGPSFESINAMGDKIESKKVVYHLFSFFLLFLCRSPPLFPNHPRKSVGCLFWCSHHPRV